MESRIRAVEIVVCDEGRACEALPSIQRSDQNDIIQEDHAESRSQ